MRPWLSVAGTRCTRCTPDSYFSRANTLRPVISAMPSFRPPSSVSLYSRISNRQPRGFGVFLVHREQFGGEQPRLVAAGRRADFQDRGARVRLILRQQREADLVLQRRDSGSFSSSQFGLGQFAHLGVGQQRLGFGLRPLGVAQFADASHHRLDFGQFLGGLDVSLAGHALGQHRAQFVGAGGDPVEFRSPDSCRQFMRSRARSPPASPPPARRCQVLHLRHALRQIVVAQNHRGAGADAVGALHAAAQVAAIRHLGPRCRPRAAPAGCRSRPPRPPRRSAPRRPAPAAAGGASSSIASRSTPAAKPTAGVGGPPISATSPS